MLPKCSRLKFVACRSRKSENNGKGQLRRTPPRHRAHPCVLPIRPHRPLASPGPLTPRPTAMWSHKPIKRPEGPLPVQGTEQGGSQLAATSLARLEAQPHVRILSYQPNRRPAPPRLIYRTATTGPPISSPPSPRLRRAGTRTAERPA